MVKNDLLIFGAGSHARRLAKAFQSKSHQVHAFITSRPNTCNSIDGIPVYCLDSLPCEISKIDVVAIGVFNRSDAYQDIAVYLKSRGYTTICWPWDYFPDLHESLGWCYWLDPEPKSLTSWQQESSYQQLASMLADQESRDAVDRIISFRSGADLPFSAFRSNESQYFNHLTLAGLPTSRPVNYLDVGAYNGDTLQQLCKYSEVRSAFLLEPDPSNYKSLTTNLAALVAEVALLRPLALPLAAGNEHGSFSLSGEGEAVTLQNFSENHGAEHRSITVVRLDDLLPAEAIDFVKIDAEGHDREAIEGMEKMLLRCAPVIAVSLYHRPHDIIDLPLYLNQILSKINYQYYIRQHMYNSFDAVLYAIPVNS